MLLAWCCTRVAEEVIAPLANSAAPGRCTSIRNSPKLTLRSPPCSPGSTTTPRGADREFRRSLALNPEYATAHQCGTRCTSLRAAVWTRRSRRSHDCPPARAGITEHRHGPGVGALFWSGRYEAAIAELKSTLALDPTFSRAHTRLWRFLAAAGRYGEAVHGTRAALPRTGSTCRGPAGLAAGLPARRMGRRSALAYARCSKRPGDCSGLAAGRDGRSSTLPLDVRIRRCSG